MATTEAPTDASKGDAHKGVHWNEENLEKNENERCATMKIDEPPTPFNFEYCQDDEEEEAAGAGAEGEAKAAEKPDVPQTAPAISFADQWEKAGLTEKLEQEKDSLIPTAEQNQITEEEREAAHKKFDENRKKHYNMREAMQAKTFDDEEDEEDEKKGAAGEAEVPHKRKAEEGKPEPR
eukprot:CAMPEP_0206234950 /NCGR_PEP_ID=MMETSP0047_2-20121206/12877_1 /ASSEMBLY_ACC=CAM_ASM_000192 /TAXON_ID=195065 /ORGANISM="Chroomonas mesostigmatica_cf, Strain CCMP1168" /LENGTH=178 /DNA_ID=CAMNT_0053659097 /DNA_START=115 /DNA_END=648 /DNA_ORIENTATION=+